MNDSSSPVVFTENSDAHPKDPLVEKKRIQKRPVRSKSPKKVESKVEKALDEKVEKKLVKNVEKAVEKNVEKTPLSEESAQSSSDALQKASNEELTTNEEPTTNDELTNNDEMEERGTSVEDLVNESLRSSDNEEFFLENENSDGESEPAKDFSRRDNLRPAPEPISLNALHALSIAQLNELAVQLQVRRVPQRVRHSLVNDIARAALHQGGQVLVDGIIEFAADMGGGAVMRWPAFSFLPCPEDVFVSGGIIRQFGLRSGNRVTGDLRLPSSGKKDKLMMLNRLHSIEGMPLDQWQPPKPFDNLTPLFPQKRIILESPNFSNPTVRAVDLIATLGQGQRGLIVAPPRAGKTVILKNIAKAIRSAYPEIHLILLLVDERPEEVTDFKREIEGADIFSSTFDEPPTRHIQVSEMVSERAKRLVEMGQHVFILLDSITRLSRGYNATQSGKGRIMSGGVEAKALLKPKKFFSAARNTEEGGSLTILATALVETNSRMDDVIFEEFKGTGNMELHLDRSLLEKRIFPAIHILKSGTRREELLYHPEELEKLQLIRKNLSELPSLEAMEVLLNSINATKSNAELLLTQFRY